MTLQKPKRRKSKKNLDKVRKEPCIVCGMKSDPHHVMTRGCGGGDDLWNLMPLCRICHIKIHKIGLYRMSQESFEVKEWLIDNGWECEEVSPGFIKWRHHGME